MDSHHFIKRVMMLSNIPVNIIKRLRESEVVPARVKLPLDVPPTVRTIFNLLEVFGLNGSDISEVTTVTVF